MPFSHELVVMGRIRSESYRNRILAPLVARLVLSSVNFNSGGENLGMNEYNKIPGETISVVIRKWVNLIKADIRALPDIRFLDFRYPDYIDPV